VCGTLEIVLPVAAVALFGYRVARAGFFGEQSCQTMTFFMFNFAIPALPSGS